MRIAFWKMHGSGNDFILIDNRSETIQSLPSVWLQKICARHTGVGAEGVILIQPSGKADFHTRFFNPDGTEVDMCGNGARCAARLAYDLGAAQEQMGIETNAGTLRADIVSSNVCLWMSPPTNWQLNQMLELRGQMLNYSFVNTGVPHVVIEVEDISAVNVQEVGVGVRYHDSFSPQGTNVNFMEVTGRNSLRVRTYERGVESETLSCGTGITACSLIAGWLGKVVPPVRVTCANNEELDVNYQLTGTGADRVSLLGPVCYVFQGMIER